MEDVEVSDGIGIFGGLMLVVVEVGGDSDDSFFNFFVEFGFSNFFYLWDC